MRFKSFLFTIISLIIIGIMFVYIIFYMQSSKNIDISEVNYIAKITEDNWGKLSISDYTECKSKFTVIDLEGNVIVTTDEKAEDGYQLNVYKGIKKSASIVDLTVNGQIVGKVIIDNFTTLKEDIIKYMLVAFTVIIFLLIVFIFGIFFYTNRRIYVPFKKINDFAVQVAKGNLEIPLEMDKENIFGAFTESFDIMREELKKAKKNEYLANLSKK